jgi:glycosyltransferase involved in cell wall biosynthesis
MKVAIIGDRGIPARYSGFSTLVEHLAVGLVQDYGFDVTVYCRNQYYDERPATYRGVRCVFLPAPGGKNFESIIHTNLAILHAVFRRYDLVFVLDPGNAPFALPLVLRRFPTVFHTDGLGWQRRKWSPLQQRYYKWSEKISAKLAGRLVTDSRAIQQYYREEYGAESSFIPYSGDVGEPATDEGLAKFGLKRGGYYLVVARLEPENNVDLIIREYRAAGCSRPLVVVGGNPYGTDYARDIGAETDESIRCVGAIYESAILNGLYRDCYGYLHGHEVGGTNPSLLRAMQAGAPCVAIDVVYHREVLGESGVFFSKAPGRLAEILRRLDREPRHLAELGKQVGTRATALYRWDAVIAAYAELFRMLAQASRNSQSLRDRAMPEFYRPQEFLPGAGKIGTTAGGVAS